MSVSFVFPGQGSQYVGMARGFLEQEDPDWLSDLEDRFPFDFQSLLTEGPKEKLDRTRYTQPLMFLTNHLVYRYLRRHDVQADFYAGHSLGEYNALVAGGWASFDDLLPVVIRRGEAMDTAARKSGGGMAAILKLDRQQLHDLCGEINRSHQNDHVQVALMNDPMQNVVSGSGAALERLVERAREEGALKAVQLDVSGPWHSPYMESAQAELEESLERVSWSQGSPTVANVTARPITLDSVHDCLIDQLVKPVKWVDSIEWLLDRGVDRFVEVGPGTVLSNLINRIARGRDESIRVLETDSFPQTEKTLTELTKCQT